MRELKPLFDEANRITSECMSGDRERELFDFLQRRKPGKGEQLTNQELEEQSRAAVAAHLQDSSVRLEVIHKNDKKWRVARDRELRSFDLECYYYRIVQPNPWYRVALFTIGLYVVVNAEEESSYENKTDGFIKWLTDRVEYTNE